MRENDVSYLRRLVERYLDRKAEADCPVSLLTA
jgi:hypothetical protein